MNPEKSPDEPGKIIKINSKEETAPAGPSGGMDRGRCMCAEAVPYFRAMLLNCVE